MRPEPRHCWCGEPKIPGQKLCDRHYYAQEFWASTQEKNWKKPDDPA